MAHFLVYVTGLRPSASLDPFSVYAPGADGSENAKAKWDYWRIETRGLFQLKPGRQVEPLPENYDARYSDAANTSGRPGWVNVARRRDIDFASMWQPTWTRAGPDHPASPLPCAILHNGKWNDFDAWENGEATGATYRTCVLRIIDTIPAEEWITAVDCHA